MGFITFWISYPKYWRIVCLWFLQQLLGGFTIQNLSLKLPINTKYLRLVPKWALWGSIPEWITHPKLSFNQSVKSWIVHKTCLTSVATSISIKVLLKDCFVPEEIVREGTVKWLQVIILSVLNHIHDWWNFYNV